jgi:hypothetical protein
LKPKAEPPYADAPDHILETYKLNQNIINEVTNERLLLLKKKIGNENKFDSENLRLFMLPPTLNAFKDDSRHFVTTMLGELDELFKYEEGKNS